MLSQAKGLGYLLRRTESRIESPSWGINTRTHIVNVHEVLVPMFCNCVLVSTRTPSSQYYWHIWNWMIPYFWGEISVCDIRILIDSWLVLPGYQEPFMTQILEDWSFQILDKIVTGENLSVVCECMWVQCECACVYSSKCVYSCVYVCVYLACVCVCNKGQEKGREK